MPQNPVSTALFCSQCGKRIGAVDGCPHCGAANDFLDVAPPASVKRPQAEPSPALQPRPWNTAKQREERSSRLEPDEAAAVTTPLSAPAQKVEDRTVPLPTSEEQSPVVALLIWKEESASEVRHELRVGTVTVGRKGADVLVESEHVSKVHASLTIRKTGSMDHSVSITDEGSSNRTFVSGQELEPLRPRELKDNDTITFADVTCRFRLRPRESAAPGGKPR